MRCVVAVAIGINSVSQGGNSIVIGNTASDATFDNCICCQSTCSCNSFGCRRNLADK